MRLTLRMKIMLCCIGVVALLDLMVIRFVRGRLSETLRAECLAKGRIMASNLADRCQSALLTDDFVALLAHVTKLKEGDEDIVYTHVTDPDGRVLAHTFQGGFPHGLVGVNVPQAGAPLRVELLDTVEEGLVHDIAAPILEGKVGFVHVGMSQRRIERTIKQSTYAVVLMAGVVLLVGAGLSGVVSWVVTRPVRSLTRAAQQIRDGHLGLQVVATSKDEIGELVESFNQMSDELLKQHNVLAERNQRIGIAKEQAAWERDKLRAIIDSMVEGVIFVDAEGRISMCNSSALRTWGKSAEDMLGRPLLECHPPKARERVAEILQHAQQTPNFAVAHTMALRKGRCVSTYSSVHSEDGRYLGLVLISQDVSEKAAMEQEHARLRDQLFQQEKMVLVGQIAASVAHELNTPLGTILLRAQLVRHQMGQDHDLSDLAVIEDEAQRCRRIIDSLLGFSRRSEGTVSATDVNALMQESLSLIQNDLGLKGITVATDYAGNDATVLADADQIQQVLLNLLANAADAMPEGGRLEIATRLLPDEGGVEVRVTDDGCGMTPDVLERAFETFYTTKERGKGTGLGLAICRRIVEEHEGQIDIRSSPGQGTTVLVRLPGVPVGAQARV